MQVQNKTKKISEALVSVFDGVGEEEAKDRAKRFKKLILKWGMTKETSEILKRFSRDWRERNGKIATVLSHEPLSSEAKQKIEESLKKNNYTFEEKIDKSVIGGVSLSLGNEYLIDGTIKGKLKKLQKIMNS